MKETSNGTEEKIILKKIIKNYQMIFDRKQNAFDRLSPF